MDAVEAGIQDTANDMQAYIYGYDFARVLLKYWEGYRNENEELKQGALRWLRGEFEKKSDAKFLGVSQIITDDTWYEFIKLLARLSTKLGYKGLLLFIDEEVNLYKITNRISRENNYEKLLTMFNDVMQGKTEYLGIFVGGTPQSVEDERRGLFSYRRIINRDTGAACGLRVKRRSEGGRRHDHGVSVDQCDVRKVCAVHPVPAAGYEHPVRRGQQRSGLLQIHE